jgi:TonB family protein
MKFWMAALLVSGSLFAADVKLLHVTSMPESKIVNRVHADYPQDAADLGVHGVVKISIVIGLDGHVESARLISGHTLLVPAALQAARKWVFEPTLVNEKPVRVATEISIPFESHPPH